jgi:hypothetical protein
MSDDTATEVRAKRALTIKTIKRRLARIDAMDDQKKARRSRNKLYANVLTAIANGEAKNPVRFAAAALTSGVEDEETVQAA